MRNKEICEGVYAVGGPGISRSEDAYVYLVDAGSELVLIDAGAGLSVEKIQKNISSLGLEPARVWHIIATHCHIDHIGGLHAFVDSFGSKIVAHEMDREGIEAGEPSRTAAGMYGIDYRPVKVNIPVRGDLEKITLGDVDFNLLHTPGHTPGSISPYIDLPCGRVLFGQDIHGPFSESWGSDLKEWRRSMEKLLALNADVLCEGHAGVYRGDKIRKYIEAYIERYA